MGKSTLLFAALTAVCSTPVLATDVLSGSVTLTAADAQQMGRLSHNGVPQDWAGDEPYSGERNTGTAYNYKTIAVAFAPNATQDVYYDITFDDVATDLFASAYLNSYDPTNKALNWLGDAGTSGNYFSGTDALCFDVKVSAGDTLVLVFNTTAGALSGTDISSTGNYGVYAFSSTEFDEDFPSASSDVPEPASWAMMVAGFGLAGGALRVRRRTIASV